VYKSDTSPFCALQDSFAASNRPSTEPSRLSTHKQASGFIRSQEYVIYQAMNRGSGGRLGGMTSDQDDS